MKMFFFGRHMSAGRACNSRKGFTLIELAFVLVIVGLLVGMGAELLPMLVKQSKLSQNRSMVKEAKTAITGYALATGRLPYASNNTAGSENTGTYRGYIPYATLGISGGDANQGTLFYAVDPYLTTTTTTDELKTALSELINNTHSPALFCDSGNIEAAFIVISAGENARADSPNDDNNNGTITNADNNQFEKPDCPVTQTYDDILDAVSLTYLYGRFD